MVKKIIFLFVLNMFFITTAQNKYSVNSKNTFDMALNSAVSGDTIEWINGTYSNIFMDITVAGITVQAATSGGVIFNGASRVEIDKDANDVTFTGFQYIGGDIDTDHVAVIYGSNVLFENINISEYTSYKYLIIDDESQYTTIKNCNFEHRINNPDQNILSILVSSSQPGFHKIQYCSFKNFDGEPDDEGSIGDAGVEAIRIGVSTTAEFESKSIIEYCYFTSCNGDGEIISHKARECIYRYNTFENNPSSELVLRHGDRGVVYSNFFINNMGGVRIQEASDHVIYNNYFNNLTDRSVYLRDDDSDPVENVLIAYNTFVNTESLLLSGGGDDTAPTNTTIANNIFSNTSNNNLIDDVVGTETWIGNMYDGTLGITIPSSGMSAENLQLSLNAEGYYSIASTSPVIDNAESGYPTLPIFSELDYDTTIALDLLLNTRPSDESLKDVGCEEYSSTNVIKPHVTEENTGPDYLNNTTLSTYTPEDSSLIDFNLFPNPLNGNTISLNFNIEETTNVNADIYSLSGRKISSLIEATNYDRGNHTFNDEIQIEPGFYLLYFKLKKGNNTTIKIQKFLKE